MFVPVKPFLTILMFVGKARDITESGAPERVFSFVGLAPDDKAIVKHTSLFFKRLPGLWNEPRVLWFNFIYKLQRLPNALAYLPNKITVPKKFYNFGQRRYNLYEVILPCWTQHVFPNFKVFFIDGLLKVE